MRFRRRRGGFSRKGTREQLIWFRQVTTTSDAAAFGTPLAIDIFNPQTFQSGNVDLRWTIRRIRAEVFTRDAFSAAAAQVMQHFAGIYLSGNTEVTRSPAFRAAADQDTDWLACTMNTYLLGAGASVNFNGPNSTGNLNPQSGCNAWAFDVRAMRKIDNDETIRIAVDDLANATDGNPTRASRILTVDVSVLFQRTRR